MKKFKGGDRWRKFWDGKLPPPRKHSTFEIGPNSHPRKVQRWLRRGGGVPIVRPLDKIAEGHIHPRHLRARSQASA